MIFRFIIFSFMYFVFVSSAYSDAFDTSLNNQNPLLPFVVNTTSGKELYSDPMWAIDIVGVLADNTAIHKSEYHGTLDTINTNKLTAKSKNYIYKLHFNFLLFGNLNTNGWELYEYSLPKEFKSLNITYRLRYTDGSRSKELYKLNVTVDGQITGGGMSGLF